MNCAWDQPSERGSWRDQVDVAVGAVEEASSAIQTALVGQSEDCDRCRVHLRWLQSMLREFLTEFADAEHEANERHRRARVLDSMRDAARWTGGR